MAPFLGRSRAAGVGIARPVRDVPHLTSYSIAVPALDAIWPISWYGWTAGHRPLAGVTDWPSVGLLALVVVALLAIGVEAFDRRDIGAFAALRWLRIPGLPRGTGGPFTRLFVGPRAGSPSPGALASGSSPR